MSHRSVSLLDTKRLKTLHPFKMFFKLFITLAFIALASAGTRVNFRACTGGHPTPLWVESDMCTADLCTLTRGQVWSGRTAFIPQSEFSTLAVDLRASLAGISFPISIPAGYEDACNFLEAGARCPVQANSEYVWAIQAPVDSSYPAAAGVQLQRKLQIFSTLTFSLINPS